MSFRYAELAQHAGVDPWALRDKFAAGNPTEITGLAKVFAGASGDAQLAADLAKEASELTAQGYMSDKTPVHDPVAHVARTKTQLGNSGEAMTRIARILDLISDDLESRTSTAKIEVATLEGEIDSIRADWARFWQQNHNTMDRHELQSTLDGYRARATAKVRERGVTIRRSVEAYEETIAKHMKTLADLGYVPPAALDKGPNRMDDILAKYQVSPDARGTVLYPPPPLGWLIGQTVTKTEAEMLDKLSWFKKKDFYDIYDDSFDTSASRYPNQDGNDSHRDAFRHAYWNALLVKEHGATWAEKYANAHEGLPGNPPDREAMDLYNNEVGRELAKKALAENPKITAEELADLIEKAVTDGQMVVIDGNGELRPSNEVAEGRTGRADDPPRDGPGGGHNSSHGSNGGSGAKSDDYHPGSEPFGSGR